MSRPIRIGMIGNVDSGKSTLVGVLTKGALDNGKGSARMSVLQFKHELTTGMTTNIATEHIKFNLLIWPATRII